MDQNQDLNQVQDLVNQLNRMKSAATALEEAKTLLSNAIHEVVEIKPQFASLQNEQADFIKNVKQQYQATIENIPAPIFPKLLDSETISQSVLELQTKLGELNDKFTHQNQLSDSTNIKAEELYLELQTKLNELNDKFTHQNQLSDSTNNKAEELYVELQTKLNALNDKFTHQNQLSNSTNKKMDALQVELQKSKENQVLLSENISILQNQSFPSYDSSSLGKINESLNNIQSQIIDIKRFNQRVEESLINSHSNFLALEQKFSNNNLKLEQRLSDKLKTSNKIIIRRLFLYTLLVLAICASIATFILLK